MMMTSPTSPKSPVVEDATTQSQPDEPTAPVGGGGSRSSGGKMRGGATGNVKRLRIQSPGPQSPPPPPSSSSSSVATGRVTKKKRQDPKIAANVDLTKFELLRDATIFAPHGQISTGEYQYIKRLIINHGEHIDAQYRPHMSYLFTNMVIEILHYVVNNTTIPSGRELRDMQKAIIKRSKPKNKIGQGILRDDQAIDKYRKGQHVEAEDNSAIRETLRISYPNLASAFDLSSLQPGLHGYVASLINIIGEEYTRLMPFNIRDAKFKLFYKTFMLDSNNGALYKPSAAYISMQKKLLKLQKKRVSPAIEDLSYDKFFAEYRADQIRSDSSSSSTSQQQTTHHQRYQPIIEQPPHASSHASSSSSSEEE